MYNNKSRTIEQWYKYLRPDIRVELEKVLFDTKYYNHFYRKRVPYSLAQAVGYINGKYTSFGYDQAKLIKEDIHENGIFSQYVDREAIVDSNSFFKVAPLWARGTLSIILKLDVERTELNCSVKDIGAVCH